MKPLPKVSLPKFDMQGLIQDFKTLDPKDPGAWPLLPRVVILVGVFAALLGTAWWFGWNPQLGELEAKRQQEQKLKDEWLNKKKQAINLEEHRKQLAEIDNSFGALLRQLPSKAEMETLLVDINQAGLGRGLQFELFKPGSETAKDFYAELPITIKLLGNYRDLGSFTGDIAKLSRIVTLNDLDIAAGKDNTLSMTTVAKTFRYLDEDEVARIKREKAAQNKGAKK